LGKGDGGGISIVTDTKMYENAVHRPMMTDTSPPAPLLQERGGKASGGYPQTPAKEAQPLWTLHYFHNDASGQRVTLNEVKGLLLQGRFFAALRMTFMQFVILSKTKGLYPQSE
jgi:hypothetical protein